MLKKIIALIILSVLGVSGAYASNSLTWGELKTLEKTIDNGFKWTEKSMGLDGYAEQKDVK